MRDIEGAKAGTQTKRRRRRKRNRKTEKKERKDTEETAERIPQAQDKISPQPTPSRRVTERNSLSRFPSRQDRAPRRDSDEVRSQGLKREK